MCVPLCMSALLTQACTGSLAVGLRLCYYSFVLPEKSKMGVMTALTCAVLAAVLGNGAALGWPDQPSICRTP